MLYAKILIHPVGHLYYRRNGPLYHARRTYRRTCETAGKSGKQIERCVIASFQIAESLGFKGDFRQWEYLLGVGE
jgi:hypothetical protein